MNGEDEEATAGEATSEATPATGGDKNPVTAEENEDATVSTGDDDNHDKKTETGKEEQGNA